MADHDPEIEILRTSVNCAALLERMPSPWRLDRQGSTRRALKYRRGVGEVLIVNHDGQGWWDPHSQAKGDIFNLVQFLEPGLNFGQVRQVLRRFVGVAPSFPQSLRADRAAAPDRPPAERWRVRPRLRHGSPAWRYLTETRRLTPAILAAADRADILREGPYGSAWFAHRDDAGQVTHIEIRGANFRGAIRGGRKTLFRLPGDPRQACRLAIAEAPIDALSLADLEGRRADTIYVATGGGMGPGTEQAIAVLLATIVHSPRAVLASATDADAAGERYAARHAEMAAKAGIAFARLRPPVGQDWNDVVRQ